MATLSDKVDFRAKKLTKIGTLYNDKNVSPSGRHNNPKCYAPQNRAAKHVE